MPPYPLIKEENSALNPLLLVATAVPKTAPSAVATTIPQPVAGATPLAAPIGPAPQTPIAQHWPWLTHGLAGIFIISALLLILLLALQTTKQEGLTGTIGGRVEGAYRGRLGAEEQLKRVTGITAVVFVITAFVLSLTGI